MGIEFNLFFLALITNERKVYINYMQNPSPLNPIAAAHSKAKSGAIGTDEILSVRFQKVLTILSFRP